MVTVSAVSAGHQDSENESAVSFLTKHRLEMLHILTFLNDSVSYLGGLVWGTAAGAAARSPSTLCTHVITSL